MCVGSPDYFDQRRAGQMDMTQALGSPGSTLKPFIYGLGFEDGFIHPETLIEDRPARYGGYAPKNFDLTFQGTVTVRKALQLSLNLPALAVLDQVGPSRLTTVAQAGDPRRARPESTPGSWPCRRALVGAAGRHRDVILPGYTHLQRAQPVLAPHYFLAYVEKLERDRARLADCRKRLNVLPLGAAALAGTALPIDRDDRRRGAGLRRRRGQQPGCLERPRLRASNRCSC